MLKNNKSKVKNLVIGIMAIALIGTVGLIINEKLFGNVSKDVETVNIEQEVEKGFEDIESIEIAEVYSEDGEFKTRNASIIENAAELEKLINLFNKKVELPNEYYCALYDNQFIINKKDGTKEEYTMLIGSKYILVNDKVMNHRIEDENVVKELSKFF